MVNGSSAEVREMREVCKELYVFESGDEARWYARATLLAAGSGRVGALYVSLPQLVMQVGTALWGPGASPEQLDAALRDLIASAPFAGAFTPLEGDTHAARLLRRSLLQALLPLVQAHAMGCPAPADLGPRDRQLVALAEAFAARTRDAKKRSWHAGHVKAMLDAGAARLPLLRDLAAIKHTVDVFSMTWAARWLEALAPGRVRALAEDARAAGGAEPRVVEHACGSPVVEVVAAARLFCGAPREGLAVLVPPQEVADWATRLENLRVPVLAYVGGGEAPSAAERVLETAAALQAGHVVAREDLRALLTTRRLAWRNLDEDGELRAGAKDVKDAKANAEVRGSDDGGGGGGADADDDEGEGPDELTKADAPPRPISETQIGRHFGRQRSATGTLAEWRARLETAKRDAEARDDARAVEAHVALLARLGRVARADTAEAMHALLRELAFRKRGGAVPAERSAASSVLERLRVSGARPFAEVWATLTQEGVGGIAGAWMDAWHEGEAAEPGAPPTRAAVWVVPWSARPERLPGLPARRVLAGLDAYPPKTPRSPWASEGLLAAHGLRTGAARSAASVTSLEATLAAPGLAVVSHRTHDASGAAIVPPAWLARWRSERRPTNDADRLPWPRGAVSAYAPGAAPPGYALAPGERGPSDGEARAELARRAEAVRAHGATTIGPWTGALGVTLPADVYSVSSLQRFALNPYRYFLEKVLGLKEEEEELGDDLDAREQGTVTHAALEEPIKERRKKNGGAWVDFAAEFEELVKDTRAALAKHYGTSLGSLLTAAVREGSVARWSDELEVFLRARHGELRKTKGATLDQVAANLAQDHEEDVKKVELYTDALAEPMTLASIDSAFVRHGKPLKGVTYSNFKKAIDDGDVRAKLKGTRDKDANAVAKRRVKAEAIRMAAPGEHVVAAERRLEVEATDTADEIPLALEIPGRRPLHIRGSIDRLEHCPRRGFVVADFKSGRALNASELGKKLESGEHLQLPLYAAAVEQLAREGRIASPDGQGTVTASRVGAVQLLSLKREKADNAPPALAIDPHLPPSDETARSAVELARLYAHAFRDAIEAGYFLLADRVELKAGGATGADALARAMRAVPRAVKERAKLRPWETREAPEAIPLKPKDFEAAHDEGAVTP
jgi:RecB family exonuclease